MACQLFSLLANDRVGSWFGRLIDSLARKQVCHCVNPGPVAHAFFVIATEVRVDFCIITEAHLCLLAGGSRLPTRWKRAENSQPLTTLAPPTHARRRMMTTACRTRSSTSSS